MEKRTDNNLGQTAKMIVVKMKEIGMVGLEKRLNGSTLMIVCVYVKSPITTVC